MLVHWNALDIICVSDIFVWVSLKNLAESRQTRKGKPRVLPCEYPMFKMDGQSKSLNVFNIRLVFILLTLIVVVSTFYGGLIIISKNNNDAY